MADSIDFSHVDWLTAGAVGEPGDRTFYIQARRDEEYVALLCEKEQVRGLAQLAQELLSRVEVTVTPDDLDEDRYQLIDGLEPSWRVGSLSLGMDPDGDRFLLEAEEVPPDDEAEPATAQFWLTRPQLVGVAAYAAFAVEAGARERCRFCGRPVDAVTGHVCPATNGHGPLTR